MFEVSTTNPAFIDPTIDSRAATFENPTGAGSGRPVLWRAQGCSEPSDQPGGARRAWGIAERVDDYCATAYVYCARP
ncbi:MAG TPA: hypothetical protein VIJ47_14830 [Acidimicrobiales bacterium]